MKHKKSPAPLAPIPAPILIPDIAKSALALLQAEFAAKVNVLAGQCLAALKLDPAHGWRVNFEQGIIAKQHTTGAP